MKLKKIRVSADVSPWKKPLRGCGILDFLKYSADSSEPCGYKRRCLRHQQENRAKKKARFLVIFSSWGQEV